MSVSDTELTLNGLDAAPRGRISIIGCGALAHEILAILKTNQMEHVSLTCLPAILHNTPDKIPNAVRDKINVLRKSGIEQIYVAYADCGTGGLLQKVCAEENVEMIEGPHCYAFFQGLEVSDQHDDITSFFLTDFLVRQFDAFVWKPLGLDKHPDLLPMYFGNYEKLVYLEQLPDPDILEKAKLCADRLGLTFEHRKTGYGDLWSFLDKAKLEN